MRYILIALVVVVVGLIGVKWAQVSALVDAGKAAEAAGPPPETVSTAMSRELSWRNTLSAVGSIATAQGVVLRNELAGVVTRLHFDSGDVVKRGRVLVELDTNVERAQLRTAQAQRQLAAQNVNRTRELAARGGVPRAQLDTDEAQLASAKAQVAELEAQIERKVVRAPFDGRLGIRGVNLGQYLEAGTSITTLESLDEAFVDFRLPQQALGQIRPGLTVRIGDEAEASVQGQITAIDPAVDEATRTIAVRASVPEQAALRPGMFATVSVVLPGEARFVVVPVTAIVRAPYGDSVFVLEPSGAPRVEGGPPLKQARQQFVRLGETRGDYVAITQGLEAGREVVTGGAFKLRNGAKVVVNNRVKPKPELAPQPENR